MSNFAAVRLLQGLVKFRYSISGFHLLPLQWKTLTDYIAVYSQ